MSSPPTCTSTGIIPACAGSTPRIRFPNLWCRDHPRLRGEHIETFLVRDGDKGSSPPARGALSA